MNMKGNSHGEDADDNDDGITNQRKRAATHVLYHEGMAKRACDSPVPDNATTDESCWTEQVHRQFVEAIMMHGMKQASPSVILDHMSYHHEALSSERVKSRLQKYRRNKDKSESEFMQEYDSWMQTALTMGATMTASPSTIAEMMGSDDRPHLLGGHAAAFLSFAALAEEHSTAQPIMMPLPPDLAPQDFVGARIPHPALTPQESQSPLGASIMRVVALCRSMTQYLLQQREATKEEATAGLEESTLLEQGDHADAPVSRPASTDFSLESSVHSNLLLTSCILPLDDNAKPRQYELEMPADNTEAIDPYDVIAYSNNDDAFLAGTP
jgi:SHAQKYF class myb-like DNA-binding protein